MPNSVHDKIEKLKKCVYCENWKLMFCANATERVRRQRCRIELVSDLVEIWGISYNWKSYVCKQMVSKFEEHNDI